MISGLGICLPWLCHKSLYTFEVTPSTLGSNSLCSRKTQLLTCHCYTKYLNYHFIYFPHPQPRVAGVCSYFQGTLLCISLHYHPHKKATIRGDGYVNYIDCCRFYSVCIYENITLYILNIYIFYLPKNKLNF